MNLPDAYPINNSQLSLAETSVEQWHKKYILEEEGFKSAYMEKGTAVHNYIANGDTELLTKDEIRRLNVVIREYGLNTIRHEVQIKQPIPPSMIIAQTPLMMYGTLDGISQDEKTIYEIKTGKDPIILEGDAIRKQIDYYLCLHNKATEVKKIWIGTEGDTSNLTVSGEHLLISEDYSKEQKEAAYYRVAMRMNTFIYNVNNYNP